MDYRFRNPSIFDRRKIEWSKDNIKNNVDKLFRNIEILDGWKYVGSEWAPVDRSKKKEELKKSIYSLLKINVKDPDAKDYQYVIQIPDLINDQFFFIGGFLKIPIFQLFDHPVIHREINTGRLIKLRTNTISIILDTNRRDKCPCIQIFGKDVPASIIISSFHNREELDNFVEMYPVESCYEDTKEIYQQIISECIEIWAKGLDTDEIHSSVGTYFMNNPNERFKKGESVLFSLKAAYEVDHYSRDFMKTDSLVLELLHSLWSGPKSDTDLKNKRIRFSEYILSPIIHKIYDMLVTLNKNHKDKYQITQNIILENCNVSDKKNSVSNVIHFNFPINPVGEIASLCQCTLVGPGGFKKDNVPPHLRNIDESHFGVICSADTPDRDGCGVILNMVPKVEVDELGNFVGNNDEVIMSYPISLVPFMQNDDATRLQMASNQIKQTILLEESECPMIKSGTEDIYMDKTTFMKRAKADGRVIYKDPSFLMVAYKTGEVEVFNINYRTMYLNTMDIIDTDLCVDDEFNEGDILCQSKFLKYGELSLGRNFLTAVAIWKGFNYEDGIVVSESVTNKMTSSHAVDLSFNIEPGQVLLSLQDDCYIPLPKVGQKLKRGEVYAKIKNLDWENNFESINEDSNEQVADLDCEVLSVEIFPNTWNKQVVEFNKFIEKLIDRQTGRYNKIISSLEPYMEQKEIDKFTTVNNLSTLNCDKIHQGNFCVKGQKISGIHVRIKAVYKEKIGIGDKIANRHGNKGVISKIIPDDMMPVLEDGRKPDVIINALGIIGRMNVGQLYELHVGESIHKLKEILRGEKDLNSRVTILKNYLDLFTVNDVSKECNDYVLDEFKSTQEDFEDFAIDNLYIYMPAFKSIDPQILRDMLDYTGAKYKYSMYDPEDDITIKNPLAVGYMYFNKLVHRSSDKLSARSIGPYNRKTSQPLGGKNNQGGHRLGEMEVWALLAHGANDFLKDLLTVHSDSIGRKNQVLANILQNPDLAEEEDSDTTPQSIRIMESYLNIVGLSLNHEQKNKSVENTDLENSSPTELIEGDDQ